MSAIDTHLREDMQPGDSGAAADARASAAKVNAIGDLVTTGRLSEPELSNTIEASASVAQARPSWAVDGGLFDPTRGWFNVNPTTLAAWLLAKRNMEAGIKSASISFLGDSRSMRSGATIRQNSTQGYLKARLLSLLGVPSAGTGMIVPWKDYDNGGTDGTWSPAAESSLSFGRDTAHGNLSFPTGWGMYTTGVVAVADDGAQTNFVQFSPKDDDGTDYVHDELRIYSIEAAGRSIFSRDGSTYYTLLANATNTPNAALVGTVVPIEAGYQRDATGGSGGQRVAKLAVPSGTHVYKFLDDGSFGTGTGYWIGFEARNTAVVGLRMNYLAQAGRALENAFQGGNAANGVSGYVLATDMLKPDLVIVDMSSNDSKDGISKATYKARLTTLVQRARATGATGAQGNGTGAGASVVIVNGGQPNYTVAPWNGVAATVLPQMLEAAYEVAMEQNVALIDTAYRWQDYNHAKPFLVDAIHPNNAGAKDTAWNIADALTAL
ncbi:SGNH/GDSL hydrolase family protein [uncultured Microbacterium sp.]|uniref:SGNH/GDSL hydrolase family protein n=1 Tax=uncultured Microbacterium sp. TaxID=191216 RepID=UPI002612C02F|nr:SGNH/GDSL hydrolase family protein [uncultured Microbacterium sp.]